MWPADPGTPIARAEFAAGLTGSAADQQGHTVVVVGRTGEVERWGPRDGQVSRIAELGDTAWTVALADALVVAGGADELVSAWTTTSASAVSLWQQAANSGGALSLAVVDGATVAIGAGDGRLRLVDLTTGDAIGTPLTLGPAPVRQVGAHGSVLWTVDRDGVVHRIDALSRRRPQP